MISVPESDFLSERHKNKVPHLFNRNNMVKFPRKLKESFHAGSENYARD
jgi:hypothetical protein